MDLNTAIEKMRVLDIRLTIQFDMIYTGVCIKANKNVWIIINYDYKKKKFDGFSIFNNNDIESYVVWKKNGLLIRENNVDDFVSLFSLSRINTMYSCLKKFSKFVFFAVYTRDDSSSYFVGKIILITKEKFQLRLIDKKKSWSKKKTFYFSDILLLSFYTQNERDLLAYKIA